MIAIEIDNPNNNYLLEDEDDFKELDITFNDTTGLNCNCDY